MSDFAKMPRFVFKLIHLPPRIAYAIGLGPVLGRMVLLLTTTGRKSGKKRVTPLQYEEIDGMYYLGAALGEKCDWVRNIRANPQVEVRVKSQRFTGIADVITDERAIADFLELRLRRHPRMIRRMLRAEGLQFPPERQDLERLAKRLALVVVQP